MSELIIEEGVSPEDAALARQLIEETPAETEASQSEPEVVEDQQDNSEDPKDTESDESVQDFTFKVKGEDKAYTKEQLQHLLSREQTFQQKYETLRNSEDYKTLIALQAAKEGDKGARKMLLDQLKEMEEDLEQLAEVEEKFDVEKKASQNNFEDAFADVKDDVDYEENLNKISSDLKSRMPAKVWEHYNSAPDTRRTMYDLIKSGRTDEIFEALNGELGKLPLGERVKAKADPEFYGMMVVEVINDLNARRDQPAETTETSDNSGLDAVSTGNSSRTVVQPVEEEIDWIALQRDNPAKFREMERKQLGRNV